MTNRSATITDVHTPSGTGEHLIFDDDVTGWGSYEFRAYRTTPGGAGDREMDTFLFRWYDQNPDNPGTQTPSADVGWKPMTDIQACMIGPHEGQWLQIVRVPHATGNSQITWALTSTTQELQRHYARQVTGHVLDKVWANIPANDTPPATEEYAALVTGEVDLVLGAPTVGGKGEFRLNVGGVPLADIIVDAAVDNTKILKLSLPRAVLSVKPTNQGNVTASYSARIITSEA